MSRFQREQLTSGLMKNHFLSLLDKGGYMKCVDQLPAPMQIRNGFLQSQYLSVYSFRSTLFMRVAVLI